MDLMKSFILKFRSDFPFVCSCWVFRTKHAEASSLYYVTYKMSSTFVAHKQSLMLMTNFANAPFFSCLFFAMNPKVFSNFESQIWYFPTGVDDGWLAGSPTNLGQGLRKSNIWCSSNGDLACFSGSRIKRNLIGICLNWGRKSEDPQATAF